MNRQYIQKLKLPEKPGVYIFRDRQGKPIYIGRATSLRDRVKSYFSYDLIKTRGPRIVDMVTKSSRLTFEATDSVLEAIILESNLIKKYQPKYNVDERDDKSDLYIIITKEDWPRVFTVRSRDWHNGSVDGVDKIFIDVAMTNAKVFGPYPHGGLITTALKILRKIFPFKDKKSHDPRYEAFYRSIGRSPDGTDTFARERYIQTIKNLSLFLNGKKTTLVKKLDKDMKLLAREMRFEEAEEVKRTIYALKHINDIALIKADADKKDQGFRIEAYDIAHISGTNVVGAMVVSTNAERQPAEYRTFKMSQEKNDDIGNLKELISRRLNHPEWTFPDLLVVDGNENQKKVVEDILSARRMNIPVVAVTKDERHRARAILGDITDVIKRHQKEIVMINAEAHRFVLAYHRRRRSSSSFQ